MKEIRIKITGTTPLICNRFTDDAQISPENAAPEKQAEKKLYIGKDGSPMIPKINLFRSLIDAGKFFKAEDRRVTTRKSSLIAACLEIDGAEISIISKGVWEVDSRAVRVRTTGRRFFAYRPKFNDWELEFTAHLDEKMMNVALLREIIVTAGKRIGLGDFRPDRKGPFGKFAVTLWEEK